MIKQFLSLVIFSLVALQVNAIGIIVLQGHYQGKNLYVQNPFAENGVGFCSFEVTINGEVTTDEVNSSAFEIDFTVRNLKIGDPVVVRIKHKDDCYPKVLNPEVLKPKSTFEITSMDVSKDGIFNWKTTKETGELTYIIEQFRWNKWIKIGEVEGRGKITSNSYKFKITPHSGENKFRVKQVDYSSKPRYSSAARYLASEDEITFSPKKAKTAVFFTAPTLFEVYDSYGNIVKKGYGKKVVVSNLKKGIYYLNYDNKTATFIKK